MIRAAWVVGLGAILLNLVGAAVTGRFALPIDLDAIGTVMGAMIAGGWVVAGAVVATVGLIPLFDPNATFVALSASQVFLAAGAVAIRGRRWVDVSSVVPASVVLGLLSGGGSVAWALMRPSGVPANRTMLIGALVGGLFQVLEVVVIFVAATTLVRFVPARFRVYPAGRVRSAARDGSPVATDDVV